MEWFHPWAGMPPTRAGGIWGAAEHSLRNQCRVGIGIPDINTFSSEAEVREMLQLSTSVPSTKELRMPGSSSQRTWGKSHGRTLPKMPLDSAGATGSCSLQCQLVKLRI